MLGLVLWLAVWAVAAVVVLLACCWAATAGGVCPAWVSLWAVRAESGWSRFRHACHPGPVRRSSGNNLFTMHTRHGFLRYAFVAPPGLSPSAASGSQAATARAKASSGSSPTATSNSTAAPGTALAPLVFVVDGPVTLEVWLEAFVAQGRALELLGGERILVAYEPPGVGFSQPSARYDYSVPAQVEVMREFLGQLPYDSYVLCCGCSHVMVALDFAAEPAAPVEALVLWQCAGLEAEMAWAARLDKWGVLRTPFLGQCVNWVLARTIMATWFRIAVSDREHCRAYTRAVAGAQADGGLFSLASLLQNMGRGLRVVPSARVPTLFLWGLADRSHRRTDKASSLTLLENAPSSEVVHLDACGHFAEFEATAEWCARVVRFLAR